MPDTQPRLVGYVTPEGELLCAYREKNESRAQFWYDRFHGKRGYDRYLIRKCPPYVADWIISMGSEEPFFPNGFKAWDYLKDAGTVLRKI